VIQFRAVFAAADGVLDLAVSDSRGVHLAGTAVALGARLDACADPNRTAEPPRTEEIESAYLKQIVASLPERRVSSLVTAAQTSFYAAGGAE